MRLRAPALLAAVILAACAAPAAGSTPDSTPAASSAVATTAEPGAAPAAFHGTVASAPQRDTVTVYKSPTCGCCAKWVDHMREHGYTVVVNDMQDVQPVKAREGVTDALSSCHTATVGGYVVEGHVPAADVQRLLSERPKITGIAVPGMPVGSPGMEGGTPDRYDVMAFDRTTGATRVFASH